MFLAERLAGPERTSFGPGASERDWCQPRVGRTRREQIQEVVRGQIKGPRRHSQSSRFILRERESHRVHV